MGLGMAVGAGTCSWTSSRGEAIDVLPLTCHSTTRPRRGTHTQRSSRTRSREWTTRFSSALRGSVDHPVGRHTSPREATGLPVPQHAYRNPSSGFACHTPERSVGRSEDRRAGQKLVATRGRHCRACIATWTRRWRHGQSSDYAPTRTLARTPSRVHRGYRLRTSIRPKTSSSPPSLVDGLPGMSSASNRSSWKAAISRCSRDPRSSQTSWSGAWNRASTVLETHQRTAPAGRWGDIRWAARRPHPLEARRTRLDRTARFAVSLAAKEPIEDGSRRWRHGRGGLGDGWRLDVVLGTFELTQVRLVERRLLLAFAVRLIGTQGFADRIARDRRIRPPTHPAKRGPDPPWCQGTSSAG